MEITKESKDVLIKFSNSEAIVLLEWLTKLNENENASLFQDQAEERIVFDLEALLEKVISETFEGNYNEILYEARQKVRDNY